MKHLKPADVILIAILIAISAFPIFSADREAGTVEITTDGGIYRYPLSDDRTEVFEGPAGNTIVEIHDGRVRILDSDCPGKTCTNGSAARGGDMLICLPNHVSVKITGGTGGVDAASY